MSKKIRVVVRDGRNVSGSAVNVDRPTPSISVGQQILRGRYQIISVIGDGGSGVVYRAIDTVLNVVVAIKVIAPDLLSDEPTVRAFKEEARLAMSIAHQNIVRVHNLEIEQGQFFLIMEHVEGCSMRDILAKGCLLDLESILRIIYACCDALEFSHKKGILHNDMKPENVMVAKDHAVKIIDFGVALLMGGGNRTFRIVGTPEYMSPEQIRGELLDMRTDVYAMGTLLHEFVTGESIFDDSLDLSKRMKPRELFSAELPSALVPVIVNCVAFDRKERWATIADFRYALIEASARLI